MRVVFFLVLCLVTCVVAILRGGRDERIGAAILMWTTVGLLALRPFFPLSLTHLDMGMFVTDVVAFVACMWLAFTTRKFWPLWFGSAQMIALLGHAMWAIESLTGPAYGVLTKGPAWLQCLILLVASLRHRPGVVRPPRSRL